MDEVFDKNYCERCGNKLVGRTTSWFVEEVICVYCSSWERKIINEVDASRDELMGCGEIPDVEFEINWGEEIPEFGESKSQLFEERGEES